mmetsp:Transcript_79142/g.219988  ORF Transcript_79142/g.219988 Transcript_79142/m.219988 type:complete len:225 (+) Transcript_79142:86-760(+)
MHVACSSGFDGIETGSCVSIPCPAHSSHNLPVRRFFFFFGRVGFGASELLGLFPRLLHFFERTRRLVEQEGAHRYDQRHKGQCVVAHIRPRHDRVADEVNQHKADVIEDGTPDRSELRNDETNDVAEHDHEQQADGDPHILVQSHEYAFAAEAFASNFGRAIHCEAGTAPRPILKVSVIRVHDETRSTPIAASARSVALCGQRPIKPVCALGVRILRGKQTEDR